MGKEICPVCEVDFMVTDLGCCLHCEKETQEQYSQTPVVKHILGELKSAIDAKLVSSYHSLLWERLTLQSKIKELENRIKELENGRTQGA